MKRAVQSVLLCALLFATTIGAEGPMWVTLSWTSSATDVVFNVHCLVTNRFAKPSYDWPIVASTTNKMISLPVAQQTPMALFAVTAERNGIESNFAW